MMGIAQRKVAVRSAEHGLGRSAAGKIASLLRRNEGRPKHVVLPPDNSAQPPDLRGQFEDENLGNGEGANLEADAALGNIQHRTAHAGAVRLKKNQR